jgi:hypothetical protein
MKILFETVNNAKTNKKGESTSKIHKITIRKSKINATQKWNNDKLAVIHESSQMSLSYLFMYSLSLSKVVPFLA